MRASTLFALTVAVLIGLGVAIAAKLGGFFNGPPVEPPAKRQDIMILAASRNLFAGDMIDASGVRMRALKPEELAHYQQHRDQYLPPVVQAAVLRIPRRNIYADDAILKDSLQDMAKPEALHSRLLPQMRAVNLSLLKEQSAGGLIQTGDWVDVFLTCTVDDSQGTSTTRTACIIPRVRIITKRNSLWPIFAPLPEDKPVNYTLEVNPYRAALLDFCRAKGTLSMAPLPAEEKVKLEAQRDGLVDAPGAVRPVSFIPPSSPEADEEEARVSAYNRGELVVAERDLVRIFGLSTAPPPPAPITVERLSGVFRYPPAFFSTQGTPLTKEDRTAASASRRAASSSSPNFQFRAPDCSKKSS